MVMDGTSVSAQQQVTSSPAAMVQQQSNQGQPVQSQSASGPQETAPNATRVAREFVRQYYTIMHESPVHLHRFYNDDSVFLHDFIGESGSTSTPVRGQQEIHRTILALNFRDCYAKIRYVDAQESINKSVVVQVAGELSNQGSPMRRFLQTFFLVSLSARKYYVRNDIFRYQDEIYVEDATEEDELNANEAVTPVTAVTQPSSIHQHGQTAMVNGTSDHISSSSAMNGSPESPTAPAAQQSASIKDEVHPQSQTSQPNDEQWATGSAAGGGGSASVAAAQTQQSPSQAQQPVQQEQQPAPTSQQQPVSSSEPAATVSAAPVNTAPRSWSQMVQVKAAADPLPPSSIQQPTFGPPANASNSQNVGIGSFGGSSVQQPQQQQQQQGLPQRPQQVGRHPGSGSRPNGSANVVSGAPKRDVSATSGGSGRDDLSVPPQQQLPIKTYSPDSHQLFVGNIPVHTTESELAKFFSKYGNVLGFRLSSSKNTGPPGNNKASPLPNYGFVTFDCAETAQKVLECLPISAEFDGPGKPPVRLNIEEKKPRTQGGRGGLRGGGAPRGGRPPMVNGGGRRDNFGNGGPVRQPRSLPPRHTGQGGGPSQH